MLWGTRFCTWGLRLCGDNTASLQEALSVKGRGALGPLSRELSLFNHKRAEYLAHGGRGKWYSNVADRDGNVRTFEDYVEHFRGTAISYEGGFIDQEHPQLAYKAATIEYDFQEEQPDVEH